MASSHGTAPQALQGADRKNFLKDLLAKKKQGFGNNKSKSSEDAAAGGATEAKKSKPAKKEAAAKKANNKSSPKKSNKVQLVEAGKTPKSAQRKNSPQHRAHNDEAVLLEPAPGNENNADDQQNDVNADRPAVVLQEAGEGNNANGHAPDAVAHILDQPLDDFRSRRTDRRANRQSRNANKKNPNQVVICDQSRPVSGLLKK